MEAAKFVQMLLNRRDDLFRKLATVLGRDDDLAARMDACPIQGSASYDALGLTGAVRCNYRDLRAVADCVLQRSYGAILPRIQGQPKIALYEANRRREERVLV